ncbi:MAG: DUF4347 domain-containing protein [Elainella sp. Prado103]|jgi:Ca2+-binding RTX toxin-like protein|nr:DUF4347 domain-containing protein [Elainella sp. Prado103]
MTSRHCPSTVVVVDALVADYSALLRSLPAQTHVVILNPAEDGIEQITQVLATVGLVESLHILSHGSVGTLQLGAGSLSWRSLDRYTPLLQTWRNWFKQGTEIFLYGCEVAANLIGQAFVQRLKTLTGAEIAASTTLVGAPVRGGNWNLDFQTGCLTTAIPFAATAMAAYPHTLALFVDETFRGGAVRDPFWVFGVGADVPGSPPAENPFLTASNSFVASPGGLPGNPGRLLDPEGEGALRLTSNIDDQSAFVLYDRPVDARQGLTITFELFSYNPTPQPEDEDQRADGVSFFLLDGATVFDANPKAGAFGGSLGYAQKVNATDALGNPIGSVAGIVGGYVGIGFDEYGNFSSTTDFPGGPVARIGGSPTRIEDSISVRGGASEYAFVAGTNTLPFGIDDPTAATREAAKRTIKVDLTPEGLLSIFIDANNDGDFLDPNETNPELQDLRIRDLNGGFIPPTFKFGFASGTGTYNNIHEVRNLAVSTLNNPPTTTDFSAIITPSSTSLLPGFFATDPDVPTDSVETYNILTLPDPSQGTLFIGDPLVGGIPVTAGANLTLEQIAAIYFEATGSFTGATFTYTATDTRGSSDETPATVTLIPQGRPPVGGNLPPTTADSSVRLPQNSAVLVPGLSGADADGSVASFTILTLPSTREGTLFLGNPNDGGVPIRLGQVLTPDEIQQVFFQSSETFTGGRFTYAATDNEGATDLTPAVVNLIFDAAVQDVVCAIGKTEKGNNRDNRIDGTAGIDTLRGLGGNDRLRGFDCNDRLDGGGGNDVLSGGADRDRLRGQQDRDVVRGNGGDDVIDLGLGRDRGFGGKGIDIIYGRRGNDRLEGRGGDDQLLGGRGRDQLYGNSNNDFLDGQQGNDFLQGGRGRDLLNGGLGNDRLRANKAADTVLGRRGNDVIWGGGGRDTLRGQIGNDRISGNTQRDLINGGFGNDIITGGGGNDRIRTGQGRDRVRFRSATHGVDRILDFDVNFDQIDLRDIFNRPEYTSANPFQDYVRIGSNDQGAILRVDLDGGSSGNFVRLAILLGVDRADLSASENFLV